MLVDFQKGLMIHCFIERLAKVGRADGRGDGGIQTSLMRAITHDEQVSRALAHHPTRGPSTKTLNRGVEARTETGFPCYVVEGRVAEFVARDIHIANAFTSHGMVTKSVTDDPATSIRAGPSCRAEGDEEPEGNGSSEDRGGHGGGFAQQRDRHEPLGGEAMPPAIRAVTRPEGGKELLLDGLEDWVIGGEVDQL
jgi:hypothetical protein